MNVKQARALRKQVGYHPSDKREYDSLKIYNYLGRVQTVKGTAVNSEKTSRAKYRELKKEFK